MVFVYVVIFVHIVIVTQRPYMCHAYQQYHANPRNNDGHGAATQTDSKLMTSMVNQALCSLCVFRGIMFH